MLESPQITGEHHDQPTNQPTTPAPAPEAAAPATSVAAPAPQGTLADKKLHVLILDYDEQQLTKQMARCRTLGHHATGVLVTNGSVRSELNDDLQHRTAKAGIHHVISNPSDAKALIDTLDPHVIMTNAMHRGGFGAPKEQVEYADLVNKGIPAVFPPSIPHVVETVLAGTILAQDGKEGKPISSRAIDLNAFLKAEAAKLNAKGHAQG